MGFTVVTGGAGFIGSNIARNLVSRGETVKVIDNLLTGKRQNLTAIKDQITFAEGSITDIDFLKRELKGASAVLHQAALASVPRSIADPALSNKINVEGTLNILIAARDAGVDRVVYAASSSVYGNAPEEPKHEDIPPDPLSPYALAKYTGEVYCKLFTKLYGLETISLRYFNVFGPQQDPNSEYAAVIPRFIIAMLKGQSPVTYGDGEQSRDFTYVANNVEANLLAARSKKGVGEVINIACGQSISLNQLVEEINAILGTHIKPHYEPARPGDVKYSQADITKAKDLLGYSPSITFTEGLRTTIQWYRSHLD